MNTEGEGKNTKHEAAPVPETPQTVDKAPAMANPSEPKAPESVPTSEVPNPPQQQHVLAVPSPSDPKLMVEERPEFGNAARLPGVIIRKAKASELAKQDPAANKGIGSL